MLLTVGGYNAFLDLITVLLIFIFVIAITLFTTKYIANYQKVQSLGKNIEVLETYKLSQTKYVQIVKIGKKYVAVAVSKDTVTLLTTLEESDITFPETENEGKSFKEILACFKQKKMTDTTETLEKTDSLEEEE